MCVKFPSNVGGTSPLQPASFKPSNPAPEQTTTPVPDAPELNLNDNLTPTSPELLKPPPFDPGEGNVHLCKYVPSEDGGLNVFKCVARPEDSENIQVYKCVAWTKTPDNLAEKLKEHLFDQMPGLSEEQKQKLEDFLSKDKNLDKIIQKIIKDLPPSNPVGPAHLCVTVPEPQFPTGPVHLCVAEVPDPDSPIGPSHLCVAEIPDPEFPTGPVHLCVAEIPEQPDFPDLPDLEDNELPDDIRELIEDILKNLPPIDNGGGIFNCAFYPERPELV